MDERELHDEAKEGRKDISKPLEESLEKKQDSDDDSIFFEYDGRLRIIEEEKRDQMIIQRISEQKGNNSAEKPSENADKIMTIPLMKCMHRISKKHENYEGERNPQNFPKHQLRNDVFFHPLSKASHSMVDFSPFPDRKEITIPNEEKLISGKNGKK